MIMSRTPFRISLFGGGTDYPAWYRRYGGAVIGTTINKYCYISIRRLPPFFEHRHRVVYSRIELPQTVEEIQHPAVRAVLLDQHITEGVEIQHHGDLPARSGTGSSSSFTVGLLNAVRAYSGLMSSPEWLALQSIRLEQEVMHENVGSQDQVWAAYGGTNVISFQPDGRFHITPIVMTVERRCELEAHMMLFFTGLSRTAAVIAGKQIANIENCVTQMRRMREMVDEAYSVLQDPKRDLREIGSLLDGAWQLKKELADPVSNPAVDGIHLAAKQAGALGAKLLGAGGGGFMLVFAEPSYHSKIRERLRSLTEVSFRTGSAGSKIVIYAPDEDLSGP